MNLERVISGLQDIFAHEMADNLDKAMDDMDITGDQQDEIYEFIYDNVPDFADKVVNLMEKLNDIDPMSIYDYITMELDYSVLKLMTPTRMMSWKPLNRNIVTEEPNDEVMVKDDEVKTESPTRKITKDEALEILDNVLKDLRSR